MSVCTYGATSHILCHTLLMVCNSFRYKCQNVFGMHIWFLIAINRFIVMKARFWNIMYASCLRINVTENTRSSDTRPMWPYITGWVWKTIHTLLSIPLVNVILAENGISIYNIKLTWKWIYIFDVPCVFLVQMIWQITESVSKKHHCSLYETILNMPSIQLDIYVPLCELT